MWRPESHETRFSQEQLDWMEENPSLVRHQMARAHPQRGGYQFATGEQRPESHAPLEASYAGGDPQGRDLGSRTARLAQSSQAGGASGARRGKPGRQDVDEYR